VKIYAVRTEDSQCSSWEKSDGEQQRCRGNQGLYRNRLGEAVHVALTTAKPKARYAVIPQRFKNWNLPRLLPMRMLDAYLAKQMGLTKPKPVSH
jgi:hypothetical protein